MNLKGDSTMQITTLLGSARKKGNTATVLGWVEEELKSLGHEVERIYLNNKSIGGCLGCDKCGENPAEIACVQKDDAIDIMEQMISSEAVLFASPIYFWAFQPKSRRLLIGATPWLPTTTNLIGLLYWKGNVSACWSPARTLMRKMLKACLFLLTELWTII